MPNVNFSGSVPVGEPVVFKADGSFEAVPAGPAFAGKFKKALVPAAKVLVSSPARRIEIALAVAALKGLESAFHFKIGI